MKVQDLLTILSQVNPELPVVFSDDDRDRLVTGVSEEPDRIMIGGDAEAWDILNGRPEVPDAPPILCECGKPADWIVHIPGEAPGQKMCFACIRIKLDNGTILSASRLNALTL